MSCGYNVLWLLLSCCGLDCCVWLGYFLILLTFFLNSESMSCLLFLYPILCVLSSFAIILQGKCKMVALNGLYACYWSVGLPHDVLGWSAMCNCSISWSNARTVYIRQFSFWFCIWHLFWYSLFCVLSSFTIILTRKREMADVLWLSSWYFVTVYVLWLFFTVSVVGPWCVTTVFPDHTILLSKLDSFRSAVVPYCLYYRFSAVLSCG